MLDNRALVDHILNLRGIAAADRKRVCGDAGAVTLLTSVIQRSINSDPIDIALREYWASQKAGDSLDNELEGE